MYETGIFLKSLIEYTEVLRDTTKRDTKKYNRYNVIQHNHKKQLFDSKDYSRYWAKFVEWITKKVLLLAAQEKKEICVSIGLTYIDYEHEIDLFSISEILENIEGDLKDLFEVYKEEIDFAIQKYFEVVNGPNTKNIHH